MFQLVIHKLFSNAWKVGCLLIGSIIVVGMICSIPIYTDGILQRMLTRDLENEQTETGKYPGYVALRANLAYVSKEQGDAISLTNREKIRSLNNMMPLDALMIEELNTTSNFYFNLLRGEDQVRKSVGLAGLSNLNDHVALSKGRLPAVRDDGIIEVLATDAGLKATEMVMDKDYEFYAFKQEDLGAPLIRLRIVGLIKPAEETDPYWYVGINSFRQSLLLDPDILNGIIASQSYLSFNEQQVYAVYDYHAFTIDQIGTIGRSTEQGRLHADTYSRTTRYDSTFGEVIKSYIPRRASLLMTLQILIVPVVLMLAFYIFMVSQLMVQSETSVIGVLESRGSSRRQILGLYALESLILGAITLIIGPFLGLWMVRIIGASNGFLEFVNRKALPVKLDWNVLLYAVLAVLVFMLTTQIPVFGQARTSIVQQKRKKSRLARAPFWQRIFLDIILLATSLYALYRMNAQLAIQQQTAVTGSDLNQDFILFLASTLFILGAGLLLLRLYPFLLQLVYLAGNRFWNPVFYASFHHIRRSDGREQFLMLFLIMALSIGIFNANAARTINQNTEDTIRAEMGADIRLQAFWQPYDAEGNALDSSGAVIGSSGGQSAAASTGDPVIKYIEPNFDAYTELDGVESAARVYKTDKVRLVRAGTTVSDINLMAIDPYSFAQTTWSRNDLLPYHMNNYMNVMTSMPNGVILSSNLKDELGLSIGDAIVYTLDNVDNVDGVVIAFVDFWPGFEPILINGEGEATPQSLLVANLETVLSRSALQPYEIWLNRSDEVTDQVIYDAIEKDKIQLISIESAAQTLAKAKNDPQLQGTNGALTLGFIVSMLICGIGFLIYWIMSVQSRVLQFGVFRAMGLSRSGVIGMIVCEQVMVSGAAVLFGILLGNLTSYLFVPLFQLVFNSADQPIPFRVIAYQSDAAKVYAILAVILAVCFAVLIRLILHIKVDQAIKLGED